MERSALPSPPRSPGAADAAVENDAADDAVRGPATTLVPAPSSDAARARARRPASFLGGTPAKVQKGAEQVLAGYLQYRASALPSALPPAPPPPRVHWHKSVVDATVEYNPDEPEEAASSVPLSEPEAPPTEEAAAAAAAPAAAPAPAESAAPAPAEEPIKIWDGNAVVPFTMTEYNRLWNEQVTEKDLRALLAVRELSTRAIFGHGVASMRRDELMVCVERTAARALKALYHTAHYREFQLTAHETDLVGSLK